MLSSIRKIEVSNFSFMNELYKTLSTCSKDQKDRFTILNENFNRIVSLQRALFNLRYGTLEQVGYYIINLIKNNTLITIKIIDNNTLLEYIVCKLLLIEIDYKIDIDIWINEICEKNRHIFEELRLIFEITSENISQSNIAKLVEIMNNLYLPDRYDILKDIIDNFTCYYKYQTPKRFDPNFYITTIGDIDTLKDYMIKEFRLLLDNDYKLDNIDIIRHPIFTKHNLITTFLDIVNLKMDRELELTIKSLNSYVSNRDVDEIYSNISKLNETIIFIDNQKLTTDFHVFINFLNSKLKR